MTLMLDDVLRKSEAVPAPPGARRLDVFLREGRRRISPEMAQRILSETNYVGQRAVDRRQVGVYADMMRRGMWTLSDALAFGLFEGRLYLVNGQHRLHAVIAYGQDVEFRVAINDCQTEQELRNLYFRFDTVMRRRTRQQILSSVGLAADKGVTKDVATATFGAVGIIVNGFRTPKAQTITDSIVSKLRVVDLRLEACEPFWPAAQQLDRALKHAQRHIKPRLLRATTFAIALMTMRYQPQRAEAFWRGVAENDGLKAADVRAVYLRDLLTRHANAGAADQGAMAACIAWNAWVEGRPLKSIKIGENYSIRIIGTPVGTRRD